MEIGYKVHQCTYLGKLDLLAKYNTVWEKMIKNSGCIGGNYYSFQEKDNKDVAEVQVTSATSILLKIYIPVSYTHLTLPTTERV